MTVRPARDDEVRRWLDEAAAEFAREQVAAGTWAGEGAFAKAREQQEALLATSAMLFLIGETPDGTPVGRLWIGLTHPRGVPGCAWLNDIEVFPGHRGRGLGRALLAAAEEAARAHGATALELNVFGANRTAVHLYETSGYRVTTQQMRKDLT
ncbi:GNAT family N-acetyltransferase [Actinoplanes sp. NPDC051861]|uniref:GNAT family N-acetyltransferase n=1 Tax=Actinoplanes sp. NPDC051861 TaxID=3155170 RepID=UPI003427F99A